MGVTKKNGLFRRKDPRQKELRESLEYRGVPFVVEPVAFTPGRWQHTIYYPGFPRSKAHTQPAGRSRKETEDSAVRQIDIVLKKHPELERPSSAKRPSSGKRQNGPSAAEISRIKRNYWRLKEPLG